MKIGYIIILSVLFSGSIVLRGQSILGSADFETLRNNVFNTPDDTSRIRLMNSLAYAYYNESKFDSCRLFGSLALDLSDSLLDTELVKNDREYENQIKILKVHAISKIALSYQDSNTYKKVDTLLYALKLVKETGNKNEEAFIYSTLGDVYSFRNQHQLCIDSYLISANLYKETGNKSEQAFALTGLAITERYLGNLGDALEHLMESLKISREINDSINIIEALLAMGFTYMYVEQWEDALACQQEALEICSLMNDSLGIARVYNDLGVTNMSAGKLDLALKNHQAALNIRLNSTDYFYTSASYAYIGSIYKEKTMYSEAIKNYNEAFRFAEIAGYKIRIINANLDLGNIYLIISENEKALKHFIKAKEQSRENDDQIGETLASLKIAEIYLDQNKTRKALEWLQKAENVVPKTAFRYLGEIYRNIAKAYFQMGDYKNAYSNIMLYSQVKDSLVVAENLEKVTTLTNRLEFENKQALRNESHEKMIQIKQKEIARQKVVRNFSLFGAFVILVLAIIVFIRFMEKKKLNFKLNATLRNLKETQSQLVHAEKMATLGELTAGVAHEIQNPLNFIKNFSEVNADLIEELKEEINNGNIKEAKALLFDIVNNEEKITEHSNRADSIVKGMLKHSRKGTKDKQPTNINKLADEYLRLAYHGLRAKNKSFNADFRLDSDENLQKVNVIPQDIGRVFLNLINNAFYACSEKARQNPNGYKPEVIVSTREIDNKVEIRIKDNGNGISDEIKDKVFQAFYSTKPTGEGTGLGLSLSYDIITTGHGGDLQVETKVNQGSEFIIQLPING